ncbi:glucosamine-6-phosphate deaminase [Fluoribacter dumoffii]|uniref:Glucosamine-6-phosphate deaminase n=1 Tax=Fluoribacter dumoffii TaxID=463 RepID=A0A377G7L1_9GAMM|nr:glucosamine-6-phosphate deaminase [Fluoribacter dumoffii]KTC89520.1 Glucosamine-6-phosphate deaminase 1 [Fluoribacter dumoffii NY 23]MCW8384711.1 glucosamine-6-phosphate deaminase [Fluoribacter dumoffii]MCW8417775.1 glucosamine-6-phosphate deaminase [Fluoribacter dumoffii]MCW8454383.1 glucosamine-6-phosphate deaminase [Fluoribacter dumoffii]MCW8461543.1 glucosamine-6-phosphate deaminase [Fluoribacter dumoffii]
MFSCVLVRETPEGMANKAARAIQMKIMENNEKKIPTVLGLATGSTPEPLYRELVRLHKEEKLDFSRVITFNLDEYLGLEPTHTQSYSYYMHHHLFDHVNIKEENIHLLDGKLPLEQLDQHAKEYENLIQEAGGIDIQILGLGVNGHIGFNEPGSALDSRTRVIKLDEKTREANKRFFNSKDEVPTHAVTMGIGTILQYSKECYLLASGSSKAAIISAVHEVSSPTVDIPATALYAHKNVTVILDEKAASLLPSTVKSTKSPLLSRSLYAHKTSEEKELFSGCKLSPV